MAKLAKIDTVPDLAEAVYRQLLRAISAGELGPSARIKQDEIATTLGVSRQPVHQALRTLKKEGFLVDAGRRGLMVATLDARALSNLYQVRGALDGLAARLAALAGVKLDPKLIAHGRGAKGVRAMIDADIRFHEAIYAASGNPVIADTAQRHWQHISRAMGAVLQPGGMGARVWDDHQAILEAINRGDAGEAERLARAHCESAGDHLAQQVHHRNGQEKAA
jgi:DNA-binding GntR family transcriptional regulator